MTNQTTDNTAVALGLLIEHVRAHVRTKQAIDLMHTERQANLYQATVQALEANTRYIRFLHKWLQDNGADIEAIESLMKAAGFVFPQAK